MSHFMLGNAHLCSEYLSEINLTWIHGAGKQQQDEDWMSSSREGTEISCVGQA
jgi:hypothetical protein